MDIGRHESESMVAGLSLLLFVVLPPAKAGSKREKQEQWDSILGGHQTHSFQDAASFFHTKDVPVIESWARAQGTVEEMLSFLLTIAREDHPVLRPFLIFMQWMGSPE